MKRTFKKIIPVMLLTGMLAGCSSYNSKPGKLEDLVGTYELSVYKMKHNPDDEDTYDRKAEIGAVAYFTVDSDGYGFYGYKDNETAARVDQVFSTFTYDEEKTNLVKAISLGDGVTSKYYSEKKVGCLDEPPMGFRDGLLKKTLSYTLHSGTMWDGKKTPIEYQYVEYKKISKETSLNKINELMGTNVKFDRPYEMKAMKGYAVYRCQASAGHESEVSDRGIYEYAVLDLNTYVNGKLNFYYSLKSNPGQQVKQLSVSVNEKGRSVKLEGLDKVYYSESSGSSLPLGGFATKWEEYTDSDLINHEWFTLYYGSQSTLDEIIEQERTPVGPYVMHRVGNSQKEYAILTYNELGELLLDGLQLSANEEFAVCLGGNSWLYFEEYLEEHTANDKVVEGSVVPGTEDLDTKHMLKATETGTYDFKIDTYQKIHIVHA